MQIFACSKIDTYLLLGFQKSSVNSVPFRRPKLFWKSIFLFKISYNKHIFACKRNASNRFALKVQAFGTNERRNFQVLLFLKIFLPEKESGRIERYWRKVQEYGRWKLDSIFIQQNFCTSNMCGTGLQNEAKEAKVFDPDVIWTRNLLIWSQTRLSSRMIADW